MNKSQQFDTDTSSASFFKETDSEYGQQKWRRTYLSNVAASMYFPLGENFTNDTGGLSSSRKEDMNNPVITPNNSWLQEGSMK